MQHVLEPSDDVQRLKCLFVCESSVIKQTHHYKTYSQYCLPEFPPTDPSSESSFAVCLRAGQHLPLPRQVFTWPLDPRQASKHCARPVQAADDDTYGNSSDNNEYDDEPPATIMQLDIDASDSDSNCNADDSNDKKN